MALRGNAFYLSRLRDPFHFQSTAASQRGEQHCSPRQRVWLTTAVPIGRAPLAWNPLMLPTLGNWESPLLQRLVKKHFKEMLESQWTHFSACQISVYYNFSPLLNFKVILQEMKMISNLLLALYSLPETHFSKRWLL